MLKYDPWPYNFIFSSALTHDYLLHVTGLLLSVPPPPLPPQWWANLDQAPEDLDKNIFRDLSPTPIP